MPSGIITTYLISRLVVGREFLNSYPDRKTAHVPTEFPITRQIGDFLCSGCDNSVLQLANAYGFVADVNSTTALLPGMESSLGIERCLSSSKAEPGPRSVKLSKIKGTPSACRSEFPSAGNADVGPLHCRYFRGERGHLLDALDHGDELGCSRFVNART